LRPGHDEWQPIVFRQLAGAFTCAIAIFFSFFLFFLLQFQSAAGLNLLWLTVFR